MTSVRRLFHIARADFTMLPREIKHTVASIAIYNLTWGFSDPFLALFFAQFTEDYTHIGLLQSLLYIIGLVALLPLGNMLDRIRHRTLLLGAKSVYPLIGLGYLSAGYFHTLWLLVPTLVLHGLMIPIVWGTTEAALRDYSPRKHEGLVFGLFYAAHRVTFAVGLVIATLVIAKIPLYFLFAPILVFPVLSMIAHRALPPHHRKAFVAGMRDVIVKDKFIGSMRNEIATLNIEGWVVYLLLFFEAVVMIVGLVFFPLFAESLGFSYQEIGILAIAMLLPSLFGYFTAELSDHSERFRNIFGGFTIAGAAAIFLATIPASFLLVVFCGFLFALGYAAAYPATSGLLTVLTPRRYTGSGTSLALIAQGVGVIFTTPLVGHLVDVTGWQQTFLVIGLACCAVVTMTLGFRAVFKKRNLLYDSTHHSHHRDPYIL